MAATNIVVTPGETALIAALERKGVAFQTKNLLVGDIHICYGEQPVYIIERKAKGDLLASIKDGRYREQKGRLLATGLPSQQIVYIIENLTNADNTVWGAICNTQYRDRCTVFQTKTVAETVEYLQHLAQSVEKFWSVETITPSVQVDIKKKVCTPQDWLVHCLSLIPKISPQIAQIIVEKYPTMQALQNICCELGETAFAELRHGASQRRIGKISSKQIYEFITKI